MPTPRDLLNAAKAEITEIDPQRRRGATRPLHAARRARTRRVRTGRGAGRRPHSPRQPRVLGRGSSVGQERAHRRVLRRRRALGLRRQDAPGPRLHRRRVGHRWLQQVEGRGPDLEDAAGALGRPAHPLPASPLTPGSRREGPAATPRLQGAPPRGRGTRFARGALSRRGRRRHDRHHRHGRRRHLEPPAPDPAQRRARRHAQGRQREDDAHRDESRRQGTDVRHATRGRQHPGHHRRLRRHRGRHGQLPDALPGERRGAHQEHPRRPRFDLPLRRSGHRLQPLRRAVLPLHDPRAATAGVGAELRRGRRPGCPAGHRRIDPGHRDDQAACSSSATRSSVVSSRTTRWTRVSARSKSVATPRARPAARTPARSSSPSTTTSACRTRSRCNQRNPARIPQRLSLGT